jgi:hypothetical protein
MKAKYLRFVTIKLVLFFGVKMNVNGNCMENERRIKLAVKICPQ